MECTGQYSIVINLHLQPYLRVHIPKCNQYKNASNKTGLEEEYQNHVRLKTEAMEIKKEEMNNIRELCNSHI